MNQIVRSGQNFFLINEDNRMYNRHFEIHTNCKATFDFLHNFHKLPKMSEAILKCHCINIHLK